MITLECPKCRNVLHIEDRHAGKSGRCNHCGARIAVPAEEVGTIKQKSTRVFWLSIAVVCVGLIGVGGFHATSKTSIVANEPTPVESVALPSDSANPPLTNSIELPGTEDGLLPRSLSPEPRISSNTKEPPTLSAGNELENTPQLQSNRYLGSEGYGRVLWGMTPDEVRGQYPDTIQGENVLVRDDTVAGLEAQIGFIFNQDVLTTVVLLVSETYINDLHYLLNYRNLQELLYKKYGPPVEDEFFWFNTLYQDDPENYGMAISAGHLILYTNWTTPETTIELSCSGENFDVDLKIIYESKAFASMKAREQEWKDLSNL